MTQGKNGMPSVLALSAWMSLPMVSGTRPASMAGSATEDTAAALAYDPVVQAGEVVRPGVAGAHVGRRRGLGDELVGGQPEPRRLRVDVGVHVYEAGDHQFAVCLDHLPSVIF